MTEERAQEQELRIKLKTAQQAYEPYWNYQTIIESYETEKETLEAEMEAAEEKRRTIEETFKKENYEDFLEYISEEDRKRIELSEVNIANAKKEFQDLIFLDSHEKLFDEQLETLEELDEVNAEIRRISAELNVSMQEEVNEEDYDARMKLKEETEHLMQEQNNLIEKRNEIVKQQSNVLANIKQVKKESEQLSKNIRSRLTELESSKQLIVNRIKKNLNIAIRKSDNRIAELQAQLKTLDDQKKNEYTAAVEIVEMDAQHIEALKSRIEHLCNELGEPVTYKEVVKEVPKETQKEVTPMSEIFQEAKNMLDQIDLEPKKVVQKIKSYGSRAIKCVTTAIKNTYTKTIDFFKNQYEEEENLLNEKSANVEVTQVEENIPEQVEEPQEEVAPESIEAEQTIETEPAFDTEFESEPTKIEEQVSEQPALEEKPTMVEESNSIVSEESSVDEKVNSSEEEKQSMNPISYILKAAKKFKMPRTQVAELIELQKETQRELQSVKEELQTFRDYAKLMNEKGMEETSALEGKKL